MNRDEILARQDELAELCERAEPVRSAESVAGVFYASPYRVRMPKWASDPCWRCGGDVSQYPVRQVDWLMQTVMCEACSQEQTRAFARALGESMDRFMQRHFDGSEDATEKVHRLRDEVLKKPAAKAAYDAQKARIDARVAERQFDGPVRD